MSKIKKIDGRIAGIASGGVETGNANQRGVETGSADPRGVGTRSANPCGVLTQHC